jgi:small-conductance mechanosensitive channel
MARRKKPENETPEERQERHIKEKIANKPNRPEKVSWNRKLANLEKLYEKIQPIEEQILDLIAQKQPIYDEMQEIREEMVNECIHPYDYLVINDDHVLCKFCNKKLKLVNE